jgi:hypothetical protein
MSKRLTAVPQNSTTGENTDPIGFETTYDGQTFFWAPGEMRAFADDGQGIGHINNNGAGSPAAAVVEDNESSKKRFPNESSTA